MFKTVLILIVLLCPFKSFAEYFIQFGTGAYFGARYVDLGHQWSRTNLSLGIGLVQDNQWEQYNLKFNYITTIVNFNQVQLQPLNLGLAVLYTTDTDFYINSPSRYPEKGYYDMTAVRAGLTYQFAFTSNHWAVFYDLTWLDQGIYTQYNNHKYGEGFLSWGFGGRYLF
jgi:hypothetical protein